MKKILSVVVAFVMVASLTACNSGSSASKTGEWVKSVEVQVPAKAGGGTDVMARTLATQVAKDAGNTLTIVNNTDGGGVVAMEKVRTSKTDGNTILYFHGTMLIKSAMGVYNKTAGEDFKVIAVSEPLEKGSYVLVTAADSDYQTTEDIVRAANVNPGELLFGVETGGTGHIMTGMFAKEAGVDIKYVEAGSDTEKLTALVGKSIDACFVNPNQAKQYVEAGKIVVLGTVSSNKEGGRSSVLPDVPSFIEQGMDISFATNNLILGPKEMDEELAKKIHDYYAAAAENEEVKSVLLPAGFGMKFLPYEEGLSLVNELQEKINIIVEELGLKN